jgi:hypothetical protein
MVDDKIQGALAETLSCFFVGKSPLGFAAFDSYITSAVLPALPPAFEA